MISTGLPITNPAIAAAVPVNELRRLITTGMSAPPIGRTIVIPKVRPAATTTARIPRVAELDSEIAPAAPAISETVPMTATAASRKVTIRPPGTRIGFPRMRPWSLPPAISEPLKVTDPMTAPRTTKIVVETSAPWSERRMKSSIATSAAAPPPTALNSDTSCGMAVIWTDRARYRPAPPPMVKPTMMIAQLVAPSPSGRVISPTRVARTATVMPEALSRLPLRAVAGEFIWCNPITKQAAPANPAKYTIVVIHSCDIDRARQPAAPDAPPPVDSPAAVVFEPSGPEAFVATGFVRNICSIRSVTTYPPTTFIAPYTTATKASP